MSPEITHLLRRAGFGASAAEVARYDAMGVSAAIDELVNYERVPDEVDANIGKSGYVGVTSRGPFAPNTVISDARQRWLFRMVHSQRPLQEKLTLFWHNHFATAYSKIAGAVSGEQATRLMAAKPSEDPARQKGQIELLRERAFGNFRDLLVGVAKDPAMLIWLDGRTNVKDRPQENFARELMELFTFGVGFYTEEDVYAGARAFTGWNLRAPGRNDATSAFEFVYNANQHDTGEKRFNFPIYPNGARTIPARSAADGLQDGLDLITACAAHPETGRRLARKLYAFFINETSPQDGAFVDELARVYYESGYDIRLVMRRLLTWPPFLSESNHFTRYSWPVEYVVRAIKEIGWVGFSVNGALTPLVNMGQQLFEPPDVAGWELGGGWFSTSSTLARMNFAATLTTNQKFNLRDASRQYGRTPESLLSYFVDRLPALEFSRDAYAAMLDYLRAGGSWTGSDDQLLLKAPGLVHVIAGAGEYQFV